SVYDAWSNNYFLNLGPLFDGDASKMALSNGNAVTLGSDSGLMNGHTLIHELTHVWQGDYDQNMLGEWTVILKSGCSQLGHLTDTDLAYAYDYDPSKQWNEYNVEEQAHIVEDWYQGVCSGKSKRKYRVNRQANPLHQYM